MFQPDVILMSGSLYNFTTWCLADIRLFSWYKFFFILTWHLPDIRFKILKKTWHQNGIRLMSGFLLSSFLKSVWEILIEVCRQTLGHLMDISLAMDSCFILRDFTNHSKHCDSHGEWKILLTILDYHKRSIHEFGEPNELTRHSGGNIKISSFWYHLNNLGNGGNRKNGQRYDKCGKNTEFGLKIINPTQNSVLHGFIVLQWKL